MRLSHATRAGVALAAGFAMGDCVLFAASVLLWSAHLQRDLGAAARDRSRAWLRVVAQGLVSIGLGFALAAHTLAVFLGAWTGQNAQPWLAAALVLLLGLPGEAMAVSLALQRGLLALALVAALAPALVALAWTPCAFAAIVVLFAWGHGLYQVGPLARELAAPWWSR